MSISKLSKNLNRFRLITFDVTDTLLKFSTPPAEQYAKIASLYGYNNINKNQLTQLFKNEFKRMYTLYPNYGKYNLNMNYIIWWQTLVINIFKNLNNDNNAVSISDNHINMIAKDLFELYKTDKCCKKIDGCCELISKIKNDNKIIGVISNSDPRLHDVINSMNLPKFNFIYTSYELDYIKPDKRIFDKVLKLNGIDNCTEALHIGNTLECDYLGAINAGWYAIHISNNSNEWKNNSNVNKNHVFNSIKCFLNELEHGDIQW